MVTYIIRRLIAAVGLLFVVSAITFSIFYLVPRLAGATPETLATRYVGRTATAETVKLTAENLGFYDPIVVQYGHWAKGIFVGAELRHGRRGRALPGALPGLLVHHPAAGLAGPARPSAGDLSLAIGASVLWLLGGVAIGVLSALRRGSLFDRAAMTLALAGVSMPIFWTGLMSLAFLSYKLGCFAAGGSYMPITQNPGRGPSRCCCPGSPWPSCSPRSTPG